MWSPSFKAHSSAIRIVVVPKGFEKPWTPFPFESRKRLLAPAWLWMMDALVFSLCQSGGGLSHLALRLSLAQGTLNEAVRTWYSKAFATHTCRSCWFGCVSLEGDTVSVSP